MLTADAALEDMALVLTAEERPGPGTSTREKRIRRTARRVGVPALLMTSGSIPEYGPTRNQVTLGRTQPLSEGWSWVLHGRGSFTIHDNMFAFPVR